MAQLIKLSFWLLLSACAGLPSGRYIQLQGPWEAEKLAQHYGVELSQLRANNPGQNFQAGAWVFIPRSMGFAEGGQEGSVAYLLEGPLAWPVPGATKISSYYGRRRGRAHEGIDIAAPRGSRVIAAQAGRVVYAGRRISGYGNMIILRHDQGLTTIYAHNKKNLVRQGQRVSKGEEIAQVGSTGRSSGPHLHFELRQADRTLDPLPYLGPSRRALLAEQ